MSPAEPHPREGEALEYVLGTQPAAEREAFGREVAADPDLASLVRGWEARLSPVAERVASVEPSPGLWTAIAARVDRAGGNGSSPSAAPGTVMAFPVSPEVVRLRRSRSLWRAGAIGAGSIAAALAVLIGTGRVPDPRPAGALVAVVNRSGELPALIVRVDRNAGTVQVRSLAAETPPGRSLELWSVVGGNVRSLGVLDPGATRIAVRPEDRARLEGATLAVSVEPPGGSPTGSATGPIIYQGKLVPE